MRRASTLRGAPSQLARGGVLSVREKRKDRSGGRCDFTEPINSFEPIHQSCRTLTGRTTNQKGGREKEKRRSREAGRTDILLPRYSKGKKGYRGEEAGTIGGIF